MKPTYEELQAQVEILKGVMQSMADAHLEDGETEAAEQFLIHIRATPAACLAQVKAEAGRSGFVAGYGAGLDCRFTNIGVELADEYAERIRQEVV